MLLVVVASTGTSYYSVVLFGVVLVQYLAVLFGVEIVMLGVLVEELVAVEVLVALVVTTSSSRGRRRNRTH